MKRLLPIVVLTVAVIASGLSTLLDQSQTALFAQIGNGSDITELLSADIDSADDEITSDIVVTLPTADQRTPTGLNEAFDVLPPRSSDSIRAPPLTS